MADSTTARCVAKRGETTLAASKAVSAQSSLTPPIYLPTFTKLKGFAKACSHWESMIWTSDHCPFRVILGGG